MNTNFLNIAEEIYLLSIDENGNQHENFKSDSFDVIIAASILMDLALRHRIDSDMQYIIPDKLDDLGDILLDGVMGDIIDYGNNRRIEDWISHLSIHGQFFRDEIITSLIRKGVLKIENEKIFWFFSKRKYPRIGNTEFEEVQSRIRHLILGEVIPEERDIVIVSILKNSNLLGTVFTEEEIEARKNRIDQIAKMDFIGQAIGGVLKTYKMPVFVSLFKSKTPEEMLDAKVQELKEKFRITNDDNLPSWLRKGNPQYEKTLEFVRERGTADVTFNPRTMKYSELNYSYYHNGIASGA